MLKKIFIGLAAFVIVLYALFLIIPYCLSGIANSHSADISKMIEDASGFKVNLDNIKLVSTPKLTIGLKVAHIDAAFSDDKFLSADNVRLKLSLIPVFLKKIEIDMVGADNVNLNLKVDQKGKFLLEDAFIPQESTGEPFVLPFGLKLSNHLPDVKVNNYKISIIEIPNQNTYSLVGNKFFVTDFILDKSIKIQTDGKLVFIDDEQFKYDIKLFNKIMPNLNLNDLIFAQQADEIQTDDVKNVAQIQYNILDVLKSLYKNKLTADINADITTFGNADDINFLGNANISNVSILSDGLPLPKSNFEFVLKNNKINLDAELYSAKDELTKLIAEFVTGKNTKISLNCKSNAKLNSIINIADSVLKTFGYKELDTLTATGGIDVDFTIKSDLKKLDTSGYLKVPSASVSYKLFNTSIDKIFADVSLNNNMINIKDAGFSILGQPLNIRGTVMEDTSADISVITDKLQIKGLLLALGQAALLKDNNISSGTVTVNALLKGKLDKIFPKVDVSIDNVNVKNVPTNILLRVPSAKLFVGEKDIVINSGYILLNNSKINYSGNVFDYLTKNINFDLKANGSILASDIKAIVPQEFRSEVSAVGALPLNITVVGNDKIQDIVFDLSANPSNYAAIIAVDDLKGKTTSIKGKVNINGETLKFENTGLFANGTQIATLKGSINDLYKTQKLNLNVATLKNVSAVIPFFKKSKIVTGFNIDVQGNSLNPVLKGSVSAPSVNIPELTVILDNLEASLNGPILKGKGTLKKIAFGDIVAESLSSDFNLVNNIFYLTNMSGSSFSGKINGNISYNISNGHIGVDVKADGMNAENAIRGTAGIKNALSGTLGFNANITTFGATDVEMIKNLKGKAGFSVTDGVFGNIGRFENMILAQNILANPIMKAAVSSVQTLPTIKNTAQFKTINGDMTFADGWAYLNPVKTSGPAMSYYIVGKYNILNATANVAVLGRISADVVNLLGPLGELSVTKLTSYIPIFGKSTGIIINAMTSDPATEKTSFIPQLSSGNTNYKDFKVEFNGGVESKSSIKSFKWLSKCDTSELDALSLKEQIQKTKDVIQETKQQQIDAFNKKLEEQRQQAQEARQQMIDAKEGLKNLFKNAGAKTEENVSEPVESKSVETPATTESKSSENDANE